MAMGLALALGGCNERPAPRLIAGQGAGLSGLVDRGCWKEEGVQPEDDAVIQRDLQRAQRVAALNREALAKLRSDRRWAEPELHEGLRS